jgi:hypothetical protein
MQRALEALAMQQKTDVFATLPPFVQQIMAQGELKGELRGELKGELRGVRDVLLRLVARAGIALTDEDRARIQACDDVATLDRWAENVLGAKTAADVFS